MKFKKIYKPKDGSSTSIQFEYCWKVGSLMQIFNPFSCAEEGRDIRQCVNLNVESMVRHTFAFCQKVIIGSTI